jgi:hypothetical protein
MFNVHCYQLEKLRKKADAIKKLRLSIHAPM